MVKAEVLVLRSGKRVAVNRIYVDEGMYVYRSLEPYKNDQLGRFRPKTGVIDDVDFFSGRVGMTGGSSEPLLLEIGRGISLKDRLAALAFEANL